MAWWLSQLSFHDVASKVRRRVLPNLKHLHRSRIRRCRACNRFSVILAFSQDEELHICIRCRANLRYEMLAASIRILYPRMGASAVLELDDRSPLQPLFRTAGSYARTYYRAGVPRGTVRADGAVCEDITELTYGDESLDLIVSSDVLEHVPDLKAAFRESARVLRPGGMHLFTVPTRIKTRQRACIESGQIRHLVDSPEYHADPLDPAGILAFWDVGPDLPAFMATDGLEITTVAGPTGVGDRVVWQARKRR
jgi:hypothetical protein